MSMRAIRQRDGTLSWVGKLPAEWRYWDINEDDHMVRLSAFDEQGMEHFALVQDVGGRAFRKIREVVREALCQHIEAGEPPGQVFPGPDDDEEDEEEDEEEDGAPSHVT